MPSAIVVLQLLVLWFAAAAAGGLLVLAARARRIEREHGLARSRRALPATVGVCGLVVLLALAGTLTALTGGAEPVPGEPRGQTASKGETAAISPRPPSDALAALEKECKELEERLAQVNRKIREERGQDEGRKEDVAAKTGAGAKDVEPLASRPPEGVPLALLILVPLLAGAGVALLFVLVDTDVLLRLFHRQSRGEHRLRARAALDQLVAAADRGDFRFGLDCAGGTAAHLLDPFERANWTFLRAYCAVQYGMDEAHRSERPGHLADAVGWLTGLLQEAPNHAEAAYLLAIAQGFLGEETGALARFAQAEAGTGMGDLPFAHNKSVCLLRMAEERMGRGEVDESNKLFDQVTRLGVLADRIPTTLVKARLLSVRRSLQAGRLAEAAEGIEVVRRLELDAELRANVDVVCDAFQTLILVRRGDDRPVLQQIDVFLARHLPGDLPTADESVADEYLESPLAGHEFRVDPSVFRAFLFLKAAALARAIGKAGTHPDTGRVNELVGALLAALQFDLRQRDALAALGGVCYWFRPEKRKKALAWLESAVAMGAEGRIARRILELDRRVETENREALEWFRAAAGRFLHDPTVSAHVRRALIEELGRFHGFQPLLLELDRATELEPQEPTVKLLRERSAYMQQVIAEYAGRKSAAGQSELDQLRLEYARLVAALEASSGRIAEIERRFVQEVGNSVLA